MPPTPAPPTDEELMAAAKEACENSHVPHFQAPSGAAVLTTDGRVFQGATVENVNHSLCICAERVAIFNAVTHGAAQIERMAVTAPEVYEHDMRGLMPCGACREVMKEFCTEDAEIIVDRLGEFTVYALLREAYQF